MSKEYLLPYQHEQLLKEMEKLSRGVRSIMQEHGTAAENGDETDNAEMDCAERKFRVLNARLESLRSLLHSSEVFPWNRVATHKVGLGCSVRVKDADKELEFRVNVVGPVLVDMDRDEVSYAAPMGNALLDHVPGETVTYKVGERVFRYAIINISRYDPTTYVSEG
jgi:transcription elongation factor GreA